MEGRLRRRRGRHIRNGFPEEENQEQNPAEGPDPLAARPAAQIINQPPDNPNIIHPQPVRLGDVPINQPIVNQPEANQPEGNRPQEDRPDENQPEVNQPEEGQPDEGNQGDPQLGPLAEVEENQPIIEEPDEDREVREFFQRNPNEGEQRINAVIIQEEDIDDSDEEGDNQYATHNGYLQRQRRDAFNPARDGNNEDNRYMGVSVYSTVLQGRFSREELSSSKSFYDQLMRSFSTKKLSKVTELTVPQGTPVSHCVSDNEDDPNESTEREKIMVHLPDNIFEQLLALSPYYEYDEVYSRKSTVNFDIIKETNLLFLFLLRYEVTLQSKKGLNFQLTPTFETAKERPENAKSFLKHVISFHESDLSVAALSLASGVDYKFFSFESFMSFATFIFRGQGLNPIEKALFSLLCLSDLLITSMKEESRMLFYQIYHWIVIFLTDFVSPWICKQNGWDALLQSGQAEKPHMKKCLTPSILLGGGLGLLLSAYILLRRKP